MKLKFFWNQDLNYSIFKGMTGWSLRLYGVTVGKVFFGIVLAKGNKKGDKKGDKGDIR